MNLYTVLALGSRTTEASALSRRLAAWHDAMVVHERRLTTRPGGVCDDECPHAEALILWFEAVAAFGSRANDLIFLRSRAARQGSATPAPVMAHAVPQREIADGAAASPARRRAPDGLAGRPYNGCHREGPSSA
jgi:hypothetical protein